MTKRDTLLRMAKRQGHLRPRDLAVVGIAPSYLQRLAERGDLVRQGRGLYRLPEAEITEHHSLAEVAKRMPKGVICLLTAMRFHELGTQNPGAIWIALPRGSRQPAAGDHDLEVVRFSPVGMEDGVRSHIIEGVRVHVTTPARTIVDAFRFRNKVGLEPALDALRDGLRRRVPLAEIRRLARVFRMERVMRPYLEALL